MKIFEKILDFLKENGIELFKKRVLLSYSGGPDSTLLFHFLLYIREKFSVHFEVFYLNHNEREDVYFEKKFIQKNCIENDVVLNLREDRVLESVERKKLGFERAARELRKKYLNEIFVEKNFDYIFTGHNLTDAVETFFINLQRNMGLRGTTPVRVIEKNYVRPLLFLTKDEVLKIVDMNGMEYIKDKTNFDETILRNRIRYNLIPFMEKFFKNGLIYFKFLFENLVEIEDTFDHIIFEKLGIFDIDEDKKCIDIDILKILEYNKKLRKNLLYYALSKIFYVNKNIINEIEKVLISRKKNIKKRMGDIFIKRVYDRVMISEKEETEDFKNFLKLEFGEKVVFNGFEIKIKKVNYDKFDFQPDHFFFGMDAGKKFYLKVFEEKDRMILFKSGIKKRISKIFIDMKIDRDLRKKMPILINDKGEILLLGNIRRSNLYPIYEDKNREFIEVYVKRVY